MNFPIPNNNLSLCKMFKIYGKSCHALVSMMLLAEKNASTVFYIYGKK